MQRVGENYKKIRNTFRYILGNLDDFDPEKDAVPFDQMEALDQYMLRQTCAFAEDVRRSYDEFAFHKIYHRHQSLLHCRLERVLLRCAERSSVHLCAEVAGKAQCSDGDLEDR